jgi:hypothetical protein
MSQKPKDPPIVHLSTWVYSLLLVFYPIPFRREYGPHMAQVFRDCCLKVHRQSGTPGMLSLWAITLFDWLKTVLEEQTQRGTAMTREKFIRLSGWGMILSGFSLLLGFLASNMDAILGRSLMGPDEVNRYEAISTFLITAGSLLLMLGFIGLLLRYGEQTGGVGKIVLRSGVLFGLLSITGAWILGVYDVGWAWTTWFISFTMIFVCLSLFGLLTLRQKLLPRWNALPLVAGIGIPLFFLISSIWEIFIDGWVNDQGVGLMILLITAVSVGLLGFVLQGDSHLEGTPA